MGDSKDYEQLKQRVLGQKSQRSVIPRDLYKLASLLARWKCQDKLPVCLLCQDVSKTIDSLGHLIPNSVLKLDPQPAFDHITGRDVGLDNMGYKAFCNECEHRFSEHGENFFTAQFKPFYEKPDEKIEIKTLTSVGHPWLYFCLISIIWRCMAFIPRNDELFDLLEILRLYILRYPDSAELSVQLSIFAPNKTIEDKLATEDPGNRRFFYGMYNAIFDIIPESTGYIGNKAWLFLGPLHVQMVYLSPPNFGEFQEIPDTCTLTTGQETFTLESVDERFFPDQAYEIIDEHGRSMLVAAMHLLPKFVSYNRSNDRFSFPDVYEKKHALSIHIEVSQTCPIPKCTIVGVKHKITHEKIIFVAMHKAMKDGNELAMALRYNPGGDDHLHYAQGIHVPGPDKVTADLRAEPPFKELIKSWIGNRQLFQDG